MPESTGVHVFWRGTSYRIANSMKSMMPLIEEFVWDQGVFETDEDPLWVFVDGELTLCLRLAHTFRGYTKADDYPRVQEFRVANMFDGKGEFIDALSMEQLRDLEEGEL